MAKKFSSGRNQKSLIKAVITAKKISAGLVKHHTHLNGIKSKRNK